MSGWIWRVWMGVLQLFRCHCLYCKTNKQSAVTIDTAPAQQIPPVFYVDDGITFKMVVRRLVGDSRLIGYIEGEEGQGAFLGATTEDLLEQLKEDVAARLKGRRWFG